MPRDQGFGDWLSFSIWERNSITTHRPKTGRLLARGIRIRGALKGKRINLEPQSVAGTRRAVGGAGGRGGESVVAGGLRDPSPWPLRTHPVGHMPVAICLLCVLFFVFFLKKGVRMGGRMDKKRSCSSEGKTLEPGSPCPPGPGRQAHTARRVGGHGLQGHALELQHQPPYYSCELGRGI